MLRQIVIPNLKRCLRTGEFLCCLNYTWESIFKKETASWKNSKKQKLVWFNTGIHFGIIVLQFWSLFKFATNVRTIFQSSMLLFPYITLFVCRLEWRASPELVQLLRRICHQGQDGN